MQKRTIAFTIYNLSAGGAERVLTTLANELCNTYNVVVITLTECASFYELKDKIKRVHCGLTDNDHGFLRQLPIYFRTLNQLTRHIRSHNVDILIGFTTTVNIFTIMAARRAKIKCIISERNNPKVRIPNHFWRILRNRNFKYANSLVVQTGASKTFFSELMPEDKINIVPNPLARSITEHRILPRNVVGNKTILTVGRLDNNKAQDMLIRAFANIPHEGWKVNLVGNGSNLQQYRALTKGLGVKDEVYFLGNQAEVWNFYNTASIFVFTSRSEGFPNALTEALYFGIPCISTDCPNGPSELIEDDKNGFLIPVDGQEDLENKLMLLINDVNLQERFSKEAIISSEKFETASVTEKWEKLIQDVLN